MLLLLDSHSSTIPKSSSSLSPSHPYLSIVPIPHSFLNKMSEPANTNDVLKGYRELHPGTEDASAEGTDSASQPIQPPPLKPEHAQNLVNELMDLLRAGDEDTQRRIDKARPVDLVFVCQGQRFDVHEWLVTSQSKVIGKALEGPFTVRCFNSYYFTISTSVALLFHDLDYA